MNKEIRFCSILDDVCPEKTDGERTYCNYYCKLHKVYRDYKYRAKEKSESNSRTCKNCKWYCKEHCSNGTSCECTEPVSEDYSCAKWEGKDE